MTNHGDIDVMLACPEGIRILRVQGALAKVLRLPRYYVTVPLEFDDDCDEHTPVYLYETPSLIYEPQVSQ